MANAYIKKEWVNGLPIKPDDLNKIEQTIDGLRPTLLWEGNTYVASSTIPLSEPLTNFDKVIICMNWGADYSGYRNFTIPLSSNPAFEEYFIGDHYVYAYTATSLAISLHLKVSGDTRSLQLISNHHVGLQVGSIANTNAVNQPFSAVRRVYGVGRRSRH